MQTRIQLKVILKNLKKMLEKRQGFISCPSPDVSGHEICAYKYKDKKFWFKDSLCNGKIFNMSEEKFNEYLKKQIEKSNFGGKYLIMLITNKNYKINKVEPKSQITSIEIVKM